MSAGLRIDLTIPCERFEVAIEWETPETALGLFGPSGAGKTSILEALAGLRQHARGRIEVGGRSWLDTGRGVRLPPEARGVGYVAQEMLLFPHLDVLGNLRLGERRARRSARRLAPERVLDLLELAALAHRRVTTLSGGERQRVALGRALCSAPELLLLDEPLASLDTPLRRRLLPYLLRVREEFGIPTLHVSHDVSEVTLLCGEVSVLEAGRVIARGRPAEVLGARSNPPAPGSDGVVNVLRGTIGAVAESIATVELESGLRVSMADEGGLVPGQRVAFELRGADILLAVGAPSRLSAQNVLAARVREVALPAADDPHAAAVVTALLGPGTEPIAAVVSRRACRELELAPGLPVSLVFKAQACRLLAAY